MIRPNDDAQQARRRERESGNTDPRGAVFVLYPDVAGTLERRAGVQVRANSLSQGALQSGGRKYEVAHPELPWVMVRKECIYRCSA